MPTKRKVNIATPILIFIVLIFVALAVTTGILSYLSLYNESINTARQQNLALVSQMDRWLAVKANQVENNVAMLRDDDISTATIINHFGVQSENIDGINLVFTGFPDGHILYGGGWNTNTFAPERAWYIAAVQSPGQIVFSEPYMSIVTQEMTFAVARTVNDANDSEGVSAASLSFGAFQNYIIQDDDSSANNSFVLNADGGLLFHISEGFAEDDVDKGFYVHLIDILQDGGYYQSGGATYIGTRQGITDWYVVTLIPTSYIIQITTPVVVGLVATSLLAIATFIVVGSVLQRMRAAAARERDAETRMRLMLDTAPLAISLYDKESEVLIANREALRMFKLSEEIRGGSKNIANTTMPEYQPDGRHSQTWLDEMLGKAYAEGYAKGEFISMCTDGELFPSEATWVRLAYENRYIVVEYLRDLTEEATLRNSEKEATELNQILMDSSPLCVEIWDENFDMVYCNQKMLDISGVATFADYKARFKEFAGEHQPDGSSSDEVLKNHFETAMRDGFVRFEWTHLTAEGEPVPYEAQFIRVVQQGKNMVIGYSFDAREIKAAAEKVFEADKRASLMMNAAPISCFMMQLKMVENNNYKFEPIDINQAALDLFGFSSQDEFKKRFLEIFPQADEGRAIEEDLSERISSVVKTGYERFEYIHQNLMGELIPCEITLVIADYQGEPAILCFQSDLRGALAAIAREQNAHELTQMYLDAAPFFVEIWNENLELVGCNEPTAKIFDLKDKDEYLSRYYEFSPEYQPCGTLSLEKNRQLVDLALHEGSSRAEWMHIDADGNLIPFETTVVRLKGENGYIVVTYNQDLRPIKAALEKEREAAEESKAKTKFLARMSHEIRTPMNSVMGIAEIELRKGTHNDEAEEAFGRIYNSSKMLLSIINDILDLSKVEAGKMEIVPIVYETSSLITDTVQLNMMYAKDKPVELELNVDQALPTHLVGDEIRIKQILNNLLSNAFKYTAKGTVTLNFRTDILSYTEAMLVIDISDTGQGMDARQLENLFGDEYSRFNIENNRSIEGTGLGMPITHSLIKMMGGDIDVQSKIGAGSTFSVRIPQKIHGEALLGAEAAQSLQKFESAKTFLNRSNFASTRTKLNGRVLVVDDVESNLYVVEGMLAPYKLDVETVDSGLKAIYRVKGDKVYDIIFMDHMMPDMDGMEATKILRDMGYDRPIVALTANATVGAAKTFLDNGFSDFISKPIDTRKLDECLRKFIKAEEAEQEAPKQPLVATVDTEPEPNEDIAYTAKQMMVIASFCEDNDRDTVGDLIERLRQKPLKRSSKAVLDKIEEQMKKGNYRNAANIARDTAYSLMVAR
ncbi:MAG: ATP-binding protein [Defluviitaleaceae bacterium]|nr:ATP-binding protein [Defluviitaleaceae bacterium]